MYTVEAKLQERWVRMASFPLLDDSIASCNRAVMSTKSHCRVVDEEARMSVYTLFMPELAVVHERFYNIRDDPDENWRDEFQQEEYDIDWRDSGF